MLAHQVEILACGMARKNWKLARFWHVFGTLALKPQWYASTYDMQFSKLLMDIN